jgi:hypothetical protein
MFAQNFAIGVHFDTNLFAFFVDDGFKVGAPLSPNEQLFRFWLRLGQPAVPPPARRNC